jgi:hypothetical protein
MEDDVGVHVALERWPALAGRRDNDSTRGRSVSCRLYVGEGRRVDDCNLPASGVITNRTVRRTRAVIGRIERGIGDALGIDIGSRKEAMRP